MTQHYQPPASDVADLLKLTKEELARRLRYELERVSDLREQCFHADARAAYWQRNAEALQAQLDRETGERVRWQATAEGRR